MNSLVLIFSKDRALQLDATLQSFLFHCSDADVTQVRVLFTSSSAAHEKQYEQLKNDYLQYNFLQFIREQTFYSDLIALLAPFDYVLFLTDDNIFIRDFKISEIIKCLENYPDAIGFSLRLGKNTTYCYSLDKQQKLPDFQEIGNKILKFNWTSSEYDFGYPLELSSSLYRVEDILPFISQLPFTNPNTLEALMERNKDVFRNDKPSLFCYEQSVTFCTPLNIVQTVWWNRSSTKIEYSPDNLAKLFDKGIRIDVVAYNNFIPNACHQEVDLQFIEKEKKHGAPLGKQPLVSIIILNYNGLKDLPECLNSIRRNTPENHEIIVVDNASTDGSLDYLRSLSDIVLIQNPVNMGCPPARAQALSLAKGDYVILLDNDTIVTKGWATKLIGNAQSDPLIGMIGPRSNYVSGPQLVQDASYGTTDELEDFAARFADTHRGELTPTVRLVGFCMFIRREVIDKIGNIDASFGRFGFEDDDFTFRAHIAGFKAVIANDVFIHHTGGPQGRGSTQYNQLLTEAWDVFKKKWDLPQNLQYGYHCSPYYLQKILSQPFDPQKHYIPLTDRATVEKLVYVVPTSADTATEEIVPVPEKAETLKKQDVRGLVSIVVIISQQTDYLKGFIEKIREHTPEKYEIIFVLTDAFNSQTKWIKELVKENTHYRLIEHNPPESSQIPFEKVIPPQPPLEKGGSRGFEHGSNLSYPVACNKGIVESKGDTVVLLDDDVLVTEGWISSMLEHLKSETDTGIVSPMTNHIDGPQRIHIKESRGDDIDEFARSFRERNRHRRIEVKNLNGFCMLFRKDLARKIGLMDERLVISDFADNDYCLRSETEGYRNLIAGDVFVQTRRDRTLVGRKGDVNLLLPGISKIFFEKWNTLDVKSPMGKKVFVLNSLETFRQLIQRGKRVEAVKALFGGYKLAPENRQIYYSFAELFIGEGKIQDTLEVLETMPEELKEDAERFVLIGYCKANMNQFEEAKQYADKALSLKNNAAKALCLKGIIARKKGNHTEAGELFNRAIKSDSGFGKAYYHLGILKRDADKGEEAFDLFERAAVLAPADEDIVNTYCDTAIELLQAERAEKVLREAASIYPFHKRLKFNLSDLLLKQGKNHEAMHVLEDALLACGIDDDTLSRALKVREMIGAKEISEIKKNISLCMIVKDEETNLVRCLSKMHPVVDEIIVADTGSSDRTKNIAAAFGAKVFDFPWTHDFSDARNFSLSKASGEWVLILDADEVIAPSDFDKVQDLVKENNDGLFANSFTTRNYMYPVSFGWNANDGEYLEEEAGTGWIPSKKVRLFPNVSNIRFENPVHEIVENSLMKAGIEIREAGIPVHHYGKLDREKQSSKGEEYFNLGKTKLEEKSEQDTSSLYEMAVQAMELGNHKKALEYWEKLTALQPDYTKAFVGLGNAYFELARYDDAVESLRKALAHEPNSRDVIALYAKFEMCAGHMEAPISVMEGLLERDPLFPTVLGLLAIAYFCSDRKREGFSLAEKLQETNFNAATYFLSFARNLIKAQQFGHAIALLEAAIEGNYATAETLTLLEESRERLKKDSILEPSVSLCMIVKDEEDTIERCVASVDKFVSEIIVVDTGSSDRTKEIAKRLGAKVYDFPWTNSFSDARNFSLSKASGEWILILDADEVIAPSDKDKLKELLVKPDSKSIAYSFTTRNYVTELNTVDWTANDGKYREEAGTGWFPGEKVRLFPNKPDIKFEYPIHERIEPSLVKSGIKIERSDVPVHHYGTLDQEKEEIKTETYYALAKKKLGEQGAHDEKALHEIAVQASNLGKHEEALEYLEKLLAIKPDSSRAHLSLGNNYFNLRRYHEALSSYRSALQLDPNLKDAIIQSALCELYTKKPELAITRLEKFTQKETEDKKALAILAAGYLSLNRTDNGLHIIKKLRSFNFDYADFISHIASTFIHNGITEYAITLLQAAIDNNITTDDTRLLLDEASAIENLNAKGIQTSVAVIIDSNSKDFRKCITAIEQHTLGMHELILVPAEPLSTDENWLQPLVNGQETYKFVQNNRKLSYAEACNKCIREASGNFIALLTDDVIVTEGWLTGMLEHAMTDADTGIVGPMTNGIEGPQGILECSGLVGSNDCARSFRQKNRRRRVNFRKLQGFCLFINGKMTEKTGLFDEQFATSEYAVEDYCLRAVTGGYKAVIGGDIFVQHTEGRKNSDIVADHEQKIEHNKTLFTDRKRFIDKWSRSDMNVPAGKELFVVNALALADELKQKGQKHDALVALLEGLKYVPESNSLQYAVLELLIESRNYTDALEMIEKMTQEMKQDHKILELAGYCKEGLELYDVADQYADQAISAKIDSAKAWNLKGLIAYKKGLFDEAGKLFQKAIELDKGYGEPYANLGAIQWNNGNREEALKLFERALILSPSVENIVVNYHSASVVLSQLERAEGVLRDATALYPLSKKLKHVLVDILLQEEKYQEAMDVYEEAMLSFGIDDDTLTLALGIRNRIGPKELKETKDPSSPTISLSMIVKNEEKNIATCLHSIESLVDEMIVVDTGSSDRTRDIARAFGAKVYDFAWTGDFSEARNFSLSQASGEWILSLDADEVIAPFDQEVLKRLLALPEYKSSAFTITTRNYVVPVSVIGWRANDGSYIKEEAGTGWYPSDKVRVFPNNPHIRFEFPVHEFVEPSLQRAGIRNIIIEIPWHHYGKLEKEKTLSKGEDYYIQGKMKLSERGEDDLIALYELGVQASELERFDEALEYFEKLSKARPDFPKAFFGMANSYYRLGRFEEAFASLEEALKLETDENALKEIVNLYASCALCLGKAESAVPLLENVLKKDPDYPMGILMIALVHCALNQKETGKRYLEKLKETRMPFETSLNDFAVFLMSVGMAAYALPIIEVAIETNPADSRFPVLLAQCQQMLKESSS